MPLDLTKLEKPRIRNGVLVARCPACAEAGADRSCEHLWIKDDGAGEYACVVNQGPDGTGHRKRIWELAGLREMPGYTCRPVRLPRVTIHREKPAPVIPRLRRLSVTEMAQIAYLRGWQYFAGLELLSQRGLLHYADVWDDGDIWPAWVIADSSRKNIQARKLDGGVWHGIKGAKAKSLPGSSASWPIGAADIRDRPIVLLTEGQPDFCAALGVAWFEGVLPDAIAPVAITGTGNATLDPESLPFFAGKRVRIAVHNDSHRAGHDAGEKWSAQLYDAGATLVDRIEFSASGLTMPDGRGIKDLSDFAVFLDDENPPPVQLLSDLSDTVETYALDSLTTPTNAEAQAHP